MTPAMGQGELPDMNAIVRDGDRRERRRYLQIGTLLVGASAALFFGTRGLTSGGLTMVAPWTAGLGVLCFARGFSLRS